MGNCLGTPADEDLSLESFNPGSHDRCRAPSPVRRPSYGGGGGSGAEGGGDRQHEVPATGRGEGRSGGSAAAVEAKLKVFTLAELKSATRNFRPDTVLGEGGFGKVFKGWAEEKTYAPSRVGVGVPIAVKKSSPDSLQGHREWEAEVRFLGKFSHPNLVKLLGYCCEDKQFLLVYEYMPKGSLENRLFRKGVEPLSWDLRLKVAIGAARGLAFLHSSEKSVIYRDFKSSNILLDAVNGNRKGSANSMFDGYVGSDVFPLQEFNAKLSDFGLAKFGPTDGRSHVTTRVVGTYGYAAPEYIATGHLYIKSDVYGFGVVLLELLTGLPALDQNRPSGCHNLAEWAKPSLFQKRKLKKIIDPRLENRFPWNAAVLVAELISRCLEGDRKKRPSMKEVLYGLEKINLIKEKPNETRTR